MAMIPDGDKFDSLLMPALRCTDAIGRHFWLSLDACSELKDGMAELGSRSLWGQVDPLISKKVAARKFDLLLDNGLVLDDEEWKANISRPEPLHVIMRMHAHPDSEEGKPQRIFVDNEAVMWERKTSLTHLAQSVLHPKPSQGWPCYTLIDVLGRKYRILYSVCHNYKLLKAFVIFDNINSDGVGTNIQEPLHRHVHGITRAVLEESFQF